MNNNFTTRYRVLFKPLIAFLLLLALFACASPQMGQEVAQGKRSFDNGDFKVAMRQLLPAAVEGNPEAQYAVGYLYYYGYGVAQDQEMGIFWMTKSAQKGFIPAQQALAMIQSQPTKETTPSSLQKPATSFKGEEAEAFPLQKTSAFIEKKPTIIKKPVASEPSKPVAKWTKVHKAEPSALQKKSPALQVKQAINQKLAARPQYVLQLVGDYDPGNFNLLKKQLGSYKTERWQVKRDGRDWYVLTYGRYHTAEEAKLALKQLPPALHAFHPWIRPGDSLQKV